MSDEFDSLDAIEKAGVEAAPSPEIDHFVIAITSGARNKVYDIKNINDHHWATTVGASYDDDECQPDC